MAFIKEKLCQLKTTLLSLNEKGFFHIFGSSVWSQLLSFLTAILVVRQLEKEAYGIYSIANNFYSYFALFVGVGLVSGVMQYCAEQRPEGEKAAIYDFSIRTGSLVNAILGVGIVLSAWWGIDNNPSVNRYLLYMCGLPMVVYISGLYSTHARIKRQNQLYSYVNMIGSLVRFVVVLVATRLFSIYGYIISSYLQELIIIAFYVIYYRRNGGCDIRFFKKTDYRLTKPLRKEIIKYSLLCCATNLTASVLSLLDVTCLNQIIGSAEMIASYRIAITVPNALVFIPASYIIFVYPYFAEHHQEPTKLKEYANRSLKFMLFVNIAVCAVLMVGAELVVKLLWGERYIDAVPVFRIMIVNYFVAGTFQKLYGNLLAAVKKVKVNLLCAAVSGVVNICLNIVLIRRYESMGAAIATLLTTVIASSIAVVYYSIWYRKQMRMTEEPGSAAS